MSLISYLKPGNERLGAVILSWLVPVWPALGLFKGATGRAGDVDERAEDDICLPQKLRIVLFPHLTVFHVMPCLLTACFPFNIFKQCNKL